MGVLLGVGLFDGVPDGVEVTGGVEVGVAELLGVGVHEEPMFSTERWSSQTTASPL